jgi:hypothetical protein
VPQGGSPFAPPLARSGKPLPIRRRALNGRWPRPRRSGNIDAGRTARRSPTRAAPARTGRDWDSPPAPFLRFEGGLALVTPVAEFDASTFPGLQADAEGIRATGIGCFFDDSVGQCVALQDSPFTSRHHPDSRAARQRCRARCWLASGRWLQARAFGFVCDGGQRQDERR